MAMVPTELIQRPLTFADYQALPDDQDYEIIDGVLYVAPRARYYHQGIVARLIRALANPVDVHGGQVIPDSDLVLEYRNTYISPDLMYFTGEQWAQVNPKDWNAISPELVIEVLSESTASRDRIVKRQLYAELGVPHYWMVVEGSREIRELTLNAAGQYDERDVAAPAIFRPTLFPELEIDLSRLFA